MMPAFYYRPEKFFVDVNVIIYDHLSIVNIDFK